MHRPLGVTIIASMMLLNGFLVIAGITIFLLLTDQLHANRDIGIMTAMFFGTTTFAMIFAIPAYGLLKLKNWGRLMSIVLVAFVVIACAAKILTQVQTGAPALQHGIDVETLLSG